MWEAPSGRAVCPSWRMYPLCGERTKRSDLHAMMAREKLIVQEKELWPPPGISLFSLQTSIVTLLGCVRLGGGWKGLVTFLQLLCCLRRLSVRSHTTQK